MSETAEEIRNLSPNPNESLSPLKLARVRSSGSLHSPKTDTNLPEDFTAVFSAYDLTPELRKKVEILLAESERLKKADFETRGKPAPPPLPPVAGWSSGLEKQNVSAADRLARNDHPPPGHHHGPSSEKQRVKEIDKVEEDVNKDLVKVVQELVVDTRAVLDPDAAQEAELQAERAAQEKGFQYTKKFQRSPAEEVAWRRDRVTNLVKNLLSLKPYVGLKGPTSVLTTQVFLDAIQFMQGVLSSKILLPWPSKGDIPSLRCVLACTANLLDDLLDSNDVLGVMAKQKSVNAQGVAVFENLLQLVSVFCRGRGSAKRRDKLCALLHKMALAIGGPRKSERVMSIHKFHLSLLETVEKEEGNDDTIAKHYQHAFSAPPSPPHPPATHPSAHHHQHFFSHRAASNHTSSAASHVSRPSSATSLRAASVYPPYSASSRPSSASSSSYKVNSSATSFIGGEPNEPNTARLSNTGKPPVFGVHPRILPTVKSVQRPQSGASTRSSIFSSSNPPPQSFSARPQSHPSPPPPDFPRGGGEGGVPLVGGPAALAGEAFVTVTAMETVYPASSKIGGGEGSGDSRTARSVSTRPPSSSRTRTTTSINCITSRGSLSGRLVEMEEGAEDVKRRKSVGAGVFPEKGVHLSRSDARFLQVAGVYTTSSTGGRGLSATERERAGPPPSADSSRHHRQTTSITALLKQQQQKPEQLQQQQNTSEVVQKTGGPQNPSSPGARPDTPRPSFSSPFRTTSTSAYPFVSPGVSTPFGALSGRGGIPEDMLWDIATHLQPTPSRQPLGGGELTAEALYAHQFAALQGWYQQPPPVGLAPWTDSQGYSENNNNNNNDLFLYPPFAPAGRGGGITSRLRSTVAHSRVRTAPASGAARERRGKFKTTAREGRGVDGSLAVTLAQPSYTAFALPHSLQAAQTTPHPAPTSSGNITVAISEWEGGSSLSDDMVDETLS